MKLSDEETRQFGTDDTCMALGEMMTTTRTTYTITLDDDPMVCKMISRAMGIKSLPFTSTAALLGRLSHYAPLALFVDVHLGPNDCGLDAVPEFRKAWPFTPILVVTADEADDAIGNALASGANDFIRKPVNKIELNARLKARVAEMNVFAGRDLVLFGPLTYSRSFRALSSGERTCHLSPSEALLVECLLLAKGMVVPKDEIKRRVWGDLTVTDNALDKKIFDVRAAMRNVSEAVTLTTTYRHGFSLALTKSQVDSKAS